MAAPVSARAVLAREATSQAANETSTSQKRRKINTDEDEEEVELLGPQHATFHSSEDAIPTPQAGTMPRDFSNLSTSADSTS